jgi:DNA (cytosine-5)-methyltransferase 1
MEDYFGIPHIAEKLSLSQKSIRRHIASGQIKAIKIGGSYRISASQLDHFLKDTKELDVGYSKKKSKITPLKKNIEETNWVTVRDLWPRKRFNDKPLFVDLFCGAGGITCGLEMAGFEGVMGLDILPAAIETYDHNNSHPGFLGDISKPEIKRQFIDGVKKKLGGRELDLLCGGFPCQGFSLSGYRVVEDPRNQLYSDLLDIVAELNPKYILMENVKGLRSMLNGQVEKKIVKDVEAAGYSVNVTVLNSANYEVPQKRERVIFIGNRIGALNMHPKPLLKESEYVTTKSAIKDLMIVNEKPEINHLMTKHSKIMQNRISDVPEGQSLYSKYSDSWKKCPWNAPSCTIKENHGGVNLHPKLPRVLTPREMARLQSFPDDYIFKGTKSKQLVQLGNAVPPLMAKALGLAIRKSMLTASSS